MHDATVRCPRATERLPYPKACYYDRYQCWRGHLDVLLHLLELRMRKKRERV